MHSLLILRSISQILECEKLQFLPDDVTQILHVLIKLKKEYDSKARSRAAPRINPGEDHTEAEAAVYPNLPVHTMDYRYAADNKRDETDDSSCNKEYNESPSITRGIIHISCKHSITKGFTAMQKGESPLMIVVPIIRRFSKRVQAKQRFLIYDNPCMARKCGERRFPHNVSLLFGFKHALNNFQNN